MYKGIKCLGTNMLVLNFVVLIERGEGGKKERLFSIVFFTVKLVLNKEIVEFKFFFKGIFFLLSLYTIR